MTVKNEPNNVVPLFKPLEELESDEDIILEEYFAEWEAAFCRYDERKPAIAFAKANAGNNMLKCIDAVIAEQNSLKTLVNDLKASKANCEERMFGFSELAKRSYRLATRERRRYRAAATVTDIGEHRGEIHALD
jgi:hypothetical protein